MKGLKVLSILITSAFIANSYAEISIENVEVGYEGLVISYSFDLPYSGMVECYFNSEKCAKIHSKASAGDCIIKNPKFFPNNKLVCNFINKTGNFTLRDNLSISGKIEDVFYEEIEYEGANRIISVNCRVRNLGSLNLFPVTKGQASIELGIKTGESLLKEVFFSDTNLEPGNSNTFGKVFSLPPETENVEIFCANYSAYGIILDPSYSSKEIVLPKAMKLEERMFRIAIFIASLIIMISMFILFKALKKPATSEKVLKDEEKIRIMKELEERIAELEVRKEVAESYKKEAQRKYYTRQIDEKMFEDLIKKYQQEKASIEAEISAIRRRMDRLS